MADAGSSGAKMNENDKIVAAYLRVIAADLEGGKARVKETGHADGWECHTVVRDEPPVRVTILTQSVPPRP